MKRFRFPPVIRLSVLLWSLQTVSAVLFISTADPNFNATAPSGELEGSGWRYQGNWGAFLGTVIGERVFLTAQHVGGQVGDPFVLNGFAYETTALFDDPKSDLRIGTIKGVFPEFAELYSRDDEPGKRVVVFGRGTRRGPEVRLSGLTGSELKGWQWGASDGRLRWGENRVETVTASGAYSGSGNSVERALESSFLVMKFDSTQGVNESHLSLGDSGGGVFIRDGAVWKLAGIHYAVDGPYNTSNLGAGFKAAIFDETGLWTGGENNWRRSPIRGGVRPGGFVSTRVSSNLRWINSILEQPVSDEAPVLQSSDSVNGVYTDEPGAVVDEVRKTIEVSLPSKARFFRLMAAAILRISNATLEGGRLVLRYE